MYNLPNFDEPILPPLLTFAEPIPHLLLLLKILTQFIVNLSLHFLWLTLVQPTPTPLLTVN